MNDSQIRITRGQAFNLAVTAAIAAGKWEDKKYITEMYLMYYDMGSKFQAASEEDTQELIKEVNNG